MTEFDTPHLFRVLGGPSGVLALLNKHEPEHSFAYDTIQMWQQRRQISRDGIPPLLYCLLKEGYNVAEFLTDPDEFA